MAMTHTKTERDQFLLNRQLKSGTFGCVVPQIVVGQQDVSTVNNLIKYVLFSLLEYFPFLLLHTPTPLDFTDCTFLSSSTLTSTKVIFHHNVFSRMIFVYFFITLIDHNNLLNRIVVLYDFTPRPHVAV